MVKNPNLLTGLPRLFRSAFLSQFWTDINGNACVILEKKDSNVSAYVKKKIDFFRKSHFESVCSTLKWQNNTIGLRACVPQTGTAPKM